MTTPMDGLRPPALRMTAAALRRVAGHVEEAGPLWTSALRAGVHHARRTLARNETERNHADMAAWTMAHSFGHQAGNPAEAAQAARTAASMMDEIADDVEAGRVAITETTDAAGLSLLNVRMNGQTMTYALAPEAE